MPPVFSRDREGANSNQIRQFAAPRRKMSLAELARRAKPWNEQWLRNQGEYLGTQTGPSDKWRHQEDITACKGNACIDHQLHALGANQSLMSAIFGGATFPLRENPRISQAADYPKYYSHPEAAAEIDRLTDLRKIHWYGNSDAAPPDL
jgi:hypothetical protein